MRGFLFKIIMKKHVIIVAGGSGTRMHTETPKQFLNINGKPLLFYTLKCFESYLKGIPIIVVLPEPYIDYWKSMIKKNDFSIIHQIAIGGQTRFHSVKNGLDLIKESCVVAIHDGVRPLVSKETLNRVFSKAEKEGNAIPVYPVNDSIRKIVSDNSEPLNRDNYRIIQTPQCFHSELLKRAYEQDYRKDFTDDASVVEALGIKINLVDGNQENIKITRPVDLKYAEALLK
jgi:2-C-methyl-D-erythritol 4-phosphate cytidylyltransferase